jgi:L-threonylcarbamoyladenylate synthase
MDHPVIVHLGEIAQLSSWVRDIPAVAFQLAEVFWPGPLTLILKRSESVLDAVTGGQDTIGVRIPNHPLTLELLKTFGSGLVGPSANRFGRISPTTAAAVREELGDAVDMVLDGGSCAVGVESTIVDVSDEHPVILRPGMITAKQIAAVLHEPVATHKKNAPRVSGSLESHYAPQTKTYLITSEKLSDYLKHLSAIELPCVVLTQQHLLDHNQSIQCILMPKTAKDYAHDLYQTLRIADKKGVKQIVIEAVPDEPEWSAIRDRLEKAAQQR